LVDTIGTAPPVGGAASATTLASGVVVPLTVTVVLVTRVPLAGEVTVIGSDPGIPCAT